MTLAEHFTRIRRRLRDAGSKVFEDAFLIALWNDGARAIAERTLGFIKTTTLPDPPFFDATVTQPWELEFLTAGRTGRVLMYDNEKGVGYTQRWEPAQLRGYEPIDAGATLGSQPWESALYGPNAPDIEYPYPTDFLSLYFMTWDDKVLYGFTRREIEEGNPAAHTLTGEPDKVFHVKRGPRKMFILYPRSVSQYVDGTDADRIFLIYAAVPTVLTLTSETPDLPLFMRRYVEYFVLAGALGAETDLKNLQLSAHYKARFTLGTETIRGMLNKLDKPRRGGLGKATERRGGRPPRPQFPTSSTVQFPKVW